MKNVLIISGHTNLAASVANKTILETSERTAAGSRNRKAWMNSIPISKSTWKPNSRNCSGQTSLYCNSLSSGTPHPPYWNAGWKRPSVTDSRTEVPETSSKDKKLVLSFTTGAPETLYSREGAMGYAIDEFLPCYKAVCRLTQMEYCGSVYTCGISYGNRTTPELIEQQREHRWNTLNVLSGYLKRSDV